MSDIVSSSINTSLCNETRSYKKMATLKLSVTLVLVVLFSSPFSSAQMSHGMDIVQTAVNNGNFKTLVAALTAADLATALKGRGPFTVFAPTDAAFAKLPAGTVQDLLQPANKGRLQQILKYHVIAGNALSSSQISKIPLPIRLLTFEGRPVTISRRGNQLQVNNATVVIPDVFATNGVIHVIDSVLLPSGGH